MIELRKLSSKDNVDIYEMLQKIPTEENGYTNKMNGSTIEELLCLG